MSVLSPYDYDWTTMTLATTTPTAPTAPTTAQHYEDIISRNVRLYLSLQSIPQTRLAEALNLTAATVSQKLTGRVSWSVADLVNTANFLGVRPEDLMDDALIEQIDRKYKKAPVDTRPRLLVGAPSGIRTLDTLIKSQLL